MLYVIGTIAFMVVMFSNLAVIGYKGFKEDTEQMLEMGSNHSH